jgi:hypothetical protein
VGIERDLVFPRESLPSTVPIVQLQQRKFQVFVAFATSTDHLLTIKETHQGPFKT